MAQTHRAVAGSAGSARRPTGRARVARTQDRVDLAPASAYEALTRQMVEGLAADLGEIKGRLDGLLFMVAGAIVLDVVLRVAALR